MYFYKVFFLLQFFVEVFKKGSISIFLFTIQRKQYSFIKIAVIQISFILIISANQISLLSRNTVDKMQANPINSAAVKTEPSQTADRSAAVKGSRQASKAAVTGPTMLTP